MPFTSVKLIPGVNTERTPTLLEAGYVSATLCRWKDALIQKIGGWVKFYQFSVSGVPRAMHAWQDLNSVSHLAAGSTSALTVITNNSGTLITPQTKTTNISPDITTTASSATVTINDPNINTITTFDSVYFATPVSVGGLILSGVYPITVVGGATVYQITAASAATTTIATATISGATQANPCVITATAHGFANGQIVYIDSVVGMTQLNGKIYTVAGAAANTFQLSGINSTGYTAYSSGGKAYGAAVPQFSTTSASASIVVTLANHGLAIGSLVAFPLSTTVGGISIAGEYTVITVPTSSTFTITSTAAAASTATAMMNSGNVQIVYYIALGPTTAGSGYGIGAYGEGGYGTGSTNPAQTGTAITSTDWSLDNWGEILVSNPAGGGLYYWRPSGGFQNSQLISTGPIFNGGLFVSMPAQILVAWASTSTLDIGVAQDPLLVQWSDQSNFLEWTVSTTTQAGSYRIPTGSTIVGASQTPQRALIWTDIDVWSMTYIGYPLVFAFNQVGASCGLVSRHAVRQFRDATYWMGRSNFFRMGAGGGVTPMPCSVWDAVFQNLDTNNLDKCWCWTNDGFDEIWYFYPSADNMTGGQCDSYAKLNVLTGEWDNGPLQRSCGIGQTVLGSPIAATSSGIIYQHEQGTDADGQAITATFTTGYFELGEGDDYAFVDLVIPDMKFTSYPSTNSANMSISLNVVNYPSDTPQTYGPYNFTSATEWITTRLRGRQMSVTVTSSDNGSFWRLGRIRYRFRPDGRQG